MAHAIKKRPPTIDEIIAWRDELVRTLAPFNQFKIRLRMCCIPKYLLYNDGRFEHIDDGLSPDMIALDRQLDATIQEVTSIMEHRFREKFYDA